MASEQDSANATATVATSDTTARLSTPPEGMSDGERERTTREKLKKTSIAGLSQHSRAGNNSAAGSEPDALIVPENPSENGGSRGRPSKKRSFEELAKQEPSSPVENGTVDTLRIGHKRMRSREVPHDANLAAEYHQPSDVQEESDEDAKKSPGGPGILVASTEGDTDSQATLEGRSKSHEHKRAPNESTTSTGAGSVDSNTAVQDPSASQTQGSATGGSFKSTLAPSSGFTNTSSASPFGAVRSPPASDAEGKSPSITSPSAFATSGLSAFAGQDKSPFGAAATAKAAGGFGGSGTSGFGGVSSGLGGGFGGGSSASSFGVGPSPFGAKSSFGGGTFASSTAGGFGTTGTGFGGGAAPKPFGGPPARFGSKSKNDDEAEASDAEDVKDQHDEREEEKQDSRFHKQDLETGEEGEETIFNARAKLYHFEKEWKERGTGVLKVNVRQEVQAAASDAEADAENGESAKIVLRARVIMRADGVHRVILNSPVFKEMKVGTESGETPTSKTMFLTGMDDGNPRLFQIKMGKEETLKELYQRIIEFKEEL
ncbi:uncharacterized protein HMPREF1541_01201 [Cyphellophora europaea CBS 101466]|uniref:RanBD1 domain-containing protein n=1 Tax=Cyphellophora europaea (strain CBS 101466) TaxID=1220924 RepID=W2SE57_CYPE1|nr:uncharacterized protein HMPREF1541_01201 [Cyphellophora europaea CBS 101466]ETN47011.1 hypothetical protein HMPREF1541_01201 [Cyphellophora europaea CBS 101466]